MLNLNATSFLDSLTDATDAQYGLPTKKTQDSPQQSFTDRLASNIVDPMQQNHMSNFGITDQHLGPANDKGLRPVLQDGYSALANGIKDNSNLLSNLSTKGNMQKLPDPTGNQMQAKKGLLGRTFDSALGSATNTATSGLSKDLSSGISSILAFL